MDSLIWEQSPSLHEPVLVASFAGWNDAGESATAAVRYLAGQLRARSFAYIEAESFFDFTETRPIVRLDDGVTREIEWPVNRFTSASIPGDHGDVVFLHGVEPQLKWKTFCSTVLACAGMLDVKHVITLGSLLADVPHTRPTPLTGFSNDRSLLKRYAIRPSQYEGPTGIVGVLNDACRRAGLESTSVWAAVPHYVGQTPSPKATLALVRQTAAMLDATVEVGELEAAAGAYEQQVSDLVSDDDEMQEYIAQLESTEDEDELQVDRLADEAERFLRDQGPGPERPYRAGE